MCIYIYKNVKYIYFDSYKTQYTETVNAIMKLYQNTRSVVSSPDGNTQLVDITTGVLQGDTIVPFHFVLRKALYYNDNDKHLGLTIEKRKGSRFLKLL